MAANGTSFVIVVKQNRYLELFNILGAVDKEHSISLEKVGIRRSNVFNKMVKRGVFVECKDGKFYMDSQIGSTFKEKRRERMLIALIVAGVFLILCKFIGIL